MRCAMNGTLVILDVLPSQYKDQLVIHDLVRHDMKTIQTGKLFVLEMTAEDNVEQIRPDNVVTMSRSMLDCCVPQLPIAQSVYISMHQDMVNIPFIRTQKSCRLDKSIMSIANAANESQLEWVKDLARKVILAEIQVQQGIQQDRRVLEFYRYVARRARSQGWFKDMQFNPVGTAPAAVVAIDNRPNPMTVFAILQTLSCISLPTTTMRCVVVCNAKSLDYYKRAMPFAEFILNTDELVRHPFDIEDYNQLLKSVEFWQHLETLGVKTALMVQDDGFLVRSDTTGLLNRLAREYDYVGAPWVDVPSNAPLKKLTGGKLTGNGGLSLRNVECMKAVAHTYPSGLFYNELQPEPEDVFFARGVNAMTPERLSSPEDARAFSSEQILSFTSLGIHKPWPYHEHAVIKTFFETLV